MSSPPPENFLNGTNNSNGSVPPPNQLSRKRKRAPAVAPSPAPSDGASTPAASTPNAPTNESLFSRGDLTGRPILTISRGPVFVPCTDTPNSQFEPYFKTDLASSNRVGFRYVPAGINPPGHATAFRTIESNPTCFRVSWEDRNANIKVTKDGLGLAGRSGYRSARCNAPMKEGKWYMEVKIVHGGGERVQYSGNSDENGGGGGPVKVRREGSHVRLGWGRREASLNTPAGADGYSYGYNDKTGDKTTLGHLRPYGKPFKTGDVIGMYISLPPRRKPNPKDPNDPAHLRRERIPIDLKGQEVFEILEYPQSKEMISLMDLSVKSTQSSSVPSMSGKKSGPATGKPPETATSGSPTKPQQPLRPLPTLGPESKIAFFINGECQGIAFQDLYDYLQLRQPKDKNQKAKEKRKAREGVKEHRQNPFDDGWLGYYPFISLFNEGAVRINPGPDFEYLPPPDIDALLEGRDPLAPPTKKPKLDSNGSAPTQDGVEEGEVDIKTTRTWRPACERYAEFMQEQWELDAIEEEEAKVELTKWHEATKREEEKAEQRKQKRREADARRRAKKAAEAEAKKREAMELPPKEEVGTATPNQLGVPGVVSALGGAGYTSSAYPSPSPLRYSTAAYDLDREIEAAALESGRSSAIPRDRSATSEPQEPSQYQTPEEGMVQDQGHDQGEEEKPEQGDVGIRVELAEGHSPAPTAASYVGHGGSEYASDFPEEEREQEEASEAYGDAGEGEEEEEAEADEGRIRPRVQYVREEEEEEEEDH
ncbi:Set1 complex component ash2 [Leucoagaricus sp. SymC.cos]|nr:Set1 complex component ash2 [Leucoagaricus sp. SymC.cos]